MAKIFVRFAHSATDLINVLIDDCSSKKESNANVTNGAQNSTAREGHQKQSEHELKPLPNSAAISEDRPEQSKNEDETVSIPLEDGAQSSNETETENHTSHTSRTESAAASGEQSKIDNIFCELIKKMPGKI